MHITARSYLTAGVAAVGAGAIALTPVQPIPGHLALTQDRAVANLAVNLAATIDPITPWVDTIKLSAENIGKLFDFYASNPLYTSPLGLTGNFSAVFPLLQTLIANQITYIKEATSGNIGVIPGQIWNNVQTFFQAPWNPGATDPDTGNYIGEYVSQTTTTYGTVLNRPVLPINQQFAFQLLPAVLGDSYASLKPIVDFTATYYSGQVVGLLGPLFAPLIQLTKSFTAIGAFFQAGDVLGAINELINIPANVTNAVLNGGGVLDLTGVVNAISPLPPEVESIGINLGGLISPPVPQNGSLVPSDQDPPTAFNGGTAFDTVAAKLTALGLKVDDPGIPVSWIGAAIGLGQFLGDQMVVVPPQTAATVAPAAAAVETAPAVAAAPAPLEDPAPAEAPAPVTAADLAPVEPPARVDVPEPAVTEVSTTAAAEEVAAEEVAEKVEAPAPTAVSAAVAQKNAAAGDSDSDNTGGGRGSHKGPRGKHAN